MVNEIRKDYVLEKYVIISSERAKRPGAFEEERIIEPPSRKEKCPFCPGKEHLTPKPIYPTPKKWKVRLIPNKFPALRNVKFWRRNDFFTKLSPYGTHDVLIETPEHNKYFHQISENDITLGLETIRKRYLDLLRKKEIVYVTVFRNEGPKGGVSLRHPHSQILASSVFPKVISEEMTAFQKYYEKENRCPYCDVIKLEIETDKRIIFKNKDYVVLAPYASFWPYESWIIPRRHLSHIGNMKKKDLHGLAKILKMLIFKYSDLFNYPSYNMMYHNFPKSEYCHFHVEILPRLKIYAGLEFFGVYINEVPPEMAAKYLELK